MPTNLTKTNHIPAIYMRICFLLFLSLISKSLAAQDLENPKPWGLHFGYSTQQTIPFNLPDYHYTQVHILGQIPIKKYMYKKINLHFFVEGGYYHARHQLLNSWFTTTAQFNNFPDDFQQEMLQKKSIHQLVFHTAVEIAHFINSKTQLYAYAAIGPMWTSKQTERLAKGIAFSDNLGIGMKFKLTKNMWISHLMVIRHESNANLQFPNSGHNTLGVRVGLVFNLTAPQKVVTQPLSLGKP